MWTYFHGWRRKVGCALLVMASTVAGMWVRSLTMYDELEFDLMNARQTLISFHGECHWIKLDNSSGPLSLHSTTDNDWSEMKILLKKITINRFEPIARIIPYWGIAVPLTLLSALLLFWPQRRPKPTAIQSPQE